MVEAHYSEFVARQQVETFDEGFDCFAYETKDGEYYLVYQSKTENNAYMADEPTEKDKIKFIGEKQIFVQPFSLITHSNIVQ